METCNEDLYLLVFRAISREKTRKGIEGGLERPRSGRRGKEAGIPRPAGRGETDREGSWGRSRKSCGAVLEAS